MVDPSQVVNRRPMRKMEAFWREELQWFHKLSRRHRKQQLKMLLRGRKVWHEVGHYRGVEVWNQTMAEWYGGVSLFDFCTQWLLKHDAVPCAMEE